jgi:tRNA-binding protein
MADFTPAPVKPTVDIAVLEQLDVRVGTIVGVEDIPKSTRLVRLSVDFGDHLRSIVAGLKQERQDPNDIAGRQALFVVNLPPREMMGQRSEGMLFDLGYADGVRPVLAVPESPVPNGVRAG